MVVTCNQILQLPSDSQLWSKLQFHLQLKLKCNRRLGQAMEGCCYRARMVDSRQQHHESDLTSVQASASVATTTTTTMETVESSRMITNQSTESATTAIRTGAALLGKNRFTAIATNAGAGGETGGENSNLYLDNGSVDLASDKLLKSRRINHLNGGTVQYVKGYPGVRLKRTVPNSRSSISTKSAYLSLHQLGLILVLSACLAQAGFWTFYFPNFLKASGYNELSDMIESVEKQINSTIDAHADALYFWRLMKDSDNEYIYPEESGCDEVFPLFRNKAIEYAEIDFQYYLKPLMSYREHLLEHRDLWFPDGPKSKSILPRQYEQDLYKVDLELKIGSFDLLANEPKLRQMRQEMVNIWRSVKRNLDSSLPCLYLRYSYRHVAADINQFALDMNLKSLHQAMEMLESAYKRMALFKEQDRVAIEKIKDDMERQQNLVMLD